MAILALFLLASLFLAAGCSGEENAAPSGAQGETASETTAASVPDESSTVAIINSGGERVEVEVEIVDNDAERRRGLMERTELAENAGMLFVFEREQILSFWMKNTLIPLSVAYIDSEDRIIDIQDMQPLDETSHPSAEPAQYALEVNQGFFGERGVEVGNEVEFPAQQGIRG